MILHVLCARGKARLRARAAQPQELAAGVQFLWNNAARAHPVRDFRTGRMRFGLKYVGLTA